MTLYVRNPDRSIRELNRDEIETMRQGGEFPVVIDDEDFLVSFDPNYRNFKLKTVGESDGTRP